jgi:hypothetical protein
VRDYLGDDVYVEHTGTVYRLFTDRDDRMHEIYLERPALIALWLFANRVDAETATIAIGTVRAKE